MSAERLYELLYQQAKPKHRFFGRRHFELAYQDFKALEVHFKKSRNILNRYENFRTRHWFRHIHVMRIGEVIEFHLDYANPDKGIMMAMTHFVVDVVPYFSARALPNKWMCE